MFHSYSLSEVLMQFLSTKIISLSDILYHIDSFCFEKISKFELFTALSFVLCLLWWIIKFFFLALCMYRTLWSGWEVMYHFPQNLNFQLHLRREVISPNPGSPNFSGFPLIHLKWYLRKSNWLFSMSLPKIFYNLHNSTFTQIISSIVSNHWWKLANLTVSFNFFYARETADRFLAEFSIHSPKHSSACVTWTEEPRSSRLNSQFHKL